MKKVFAVMLFCLLSATAHAEKKDADGCKDHPFFPETRDYYIFMCTEDPETGVDIDIMNGTTTARVHAEGTSRAVMHNPQPGLKSKPSEARLRADFENAVKQQGGKLLGVTFGQKWPLYKIDKNGKEFWVLLMVKSGEYYDGSYTYRIIEK